MVKDFLGNEITHDILGRPIKSKAKREPVSISQKNEVLARQKNKCAHCNKSLDMRAKHFDHLKEVYKSGKSTISNLQALCANCHSIKTHQDNLKKVEKNRNNNSGGKNVRINPYTGEKENFNLFKL